MYPRFESLLSSFWLEIRVELSRRARLLKRQRMIIRARKTFVPACHICLKKDCTPSSLKKIEFLSLI